MAANDIESARNAVETTTLSNDNANNNNNNNESTRTTLIQVVAPTPATTTTTPANDQPTAAAAAAAEQHDQPMTTVTTVTTTTTTHAPAGNGKMDSDPVSMTNFKMLYILTQLCGITMVVLVGCWIGNFFGGVAWQSQPSVEFNWHPLLMTIGLIFLYGNSILIYRGFRSTRKKTLKLTHAGLHMGAFILTVIALKAVFDSHNLAATPIANMYSLHSWLGLSAVLVFSMQYVCGFVAYLAPGIRENYKIAYMPMHIYFGLFGFVLAIASALMGITEKAIFAIPGYSSMPKAGVMANVIGVLYVVFGGLVIYLSTEPAYKRKPIPEDTMLLTNTAQ